MNNNTNDNSIKHWYLLHSHCVCGGGYSLTVYMNDKAGDHTCDGKDLGGKEMVRMY